jgi:hypothetical protein
MTDDESRLDNIEARLCALEEPADESLASVLLLFWCISGLLVWASVAISWWFLVLAVPVVAITCFGSWLEFMVSYWDRRTEEHQ